MRWEQCHTGTRTRTYHRYRVSKQLDNHSNIARYVCQLPNTSTSLCRYGCALALITPSTQVAGGHQIDRSGSTTWISSCLGTEIKHEAFRLNNASAILHGNAVTLLDTIHHRRGTDVHACSFDCQWTGGMQRRSIDQKGCCPAPTLTCSRLISLDPTRTEQTQGFHTPATDADVWIEVDRGRITN